MPEVRPQRGHGEVYFSHLLAVPRFAEFVSFFDGKLLTGPLDYLHCGVGLEELKAIAKGSPLAGCCVNRHRTEGKSKIQLNDLAQRNWSC